MANWTIKNVALRGVTGTVPNRPVKTAGDRPALKKEGFLMRDPRMVERKKAGQPKARKRFQFSKR